MSKDSEEPFRNWDYLISRIEEQEDTEGEEKREIIKNWGHLRVNLGEDWLKEEKNNGHPLWSYLFNEAPWSIRWVSELGFGIEALKSKANFDKIFDRLLSPEDFEEAYCEFRVALSLLKAEVTFEFLETKRKKKTPDIVITSGQRPLFIEITKKNAPEDYIRASKNFGAIHNFLFSKKDDIDFYFDIQKPLSTPRTKGILKEVEKLVEMASVSGFERLHIPGTIDLYVFKKEKRNLVPKEKRVMRGQMPKFDEIFRIRGTIKAKVAQFKNHSPGVLLIFDSLLWPPKDTKIFYKSLLEKLEETVNESPELSALVVYIETYYILDEGTFEKIGKNYIAIKGINKKLLRSRNKLIILNEFADYPLSSAEVEILKAI